MRIENLVSLVGGELKNSPSITSVTGISSDISTLRRGDLFIAKEKETIPDAIRQGAYAILFSGWAQIADPEIAWIKVEDLDEAAKRVLRYILIRQKIAIYSLSDIDFAFCAHCIHDPDLFLSSDDPLEDLKRLLRKEYRVALFKEKGYFSSLGLEDTPLPSMPIKIIRTYPLECSFIHQERYYERIPFAPLFLPQIEKVLTLGAVQRLHLTFDAPHPHHFTPHFLGENFGIKEFGKGERVLLTERDHTLASSERNYLQNALPWAKILFVSDSDIAGFAKVEDFEELKEMLYNSWFHYALYVGKPFDPHLLWRPFRQRSLL